MVLALVVPLAGALLIVLTGSKPNLRETVTLVTACSLFALVASIFPAVMAGARPSVTVVAMFPGISLTLTAEPLGMIFAGIASFLWIITSVYSIGYMRGHHEKNQTRFYAFFAIALTCTMGVAFSGNVLTLFTFYEAITVSTFPLVTHSGTDEARRAGRTYLGVLLGSSIGLLLLGVAATWMITGTLDFTEGGILAGKASDGMIALLLPLYMFGIGKAALMPLHRWLPAAMVAPTPVSALLHAVAVVKAGVFSVVKVIVYIFGIDTLASIGGSGWLVYAAGFTLVVGSLVALTQDNLKRRLAYSTISQLSYIVIAAALFTPISIVGAAVHIVAHAFAKITLFFCAGAIMVASHKTEVSQLDGIGRRMPWTMVAFAIGALSMIGVPLTAGFVSKWYILQGALQADNMFVVAVLFLSTLLNAGYFLPIVYAAFFRRPAEALPAAAAPNGGPASQAVVEHGEAPLPIVLAQTATAVGTVVLFFLPNIPIALAERIFGG
jgi:multicomponent Na+:H+ antiporter subunit D